MGGRKEGRKGRRATEGGKEKKIKRGKGEECFSWHVKCFYRILKTCSVLLLNIVLSHYKTSKV